MREEHIQPGAIVQHLPTLGMYRIDAIGKARLPSGEWVRAVRYVSLRDLGGTEYYRPLSDFDTFALLQSPPAHGVTGTPAPSRSAALWDAIAELVVACGGSAADFPEELTNKISGIVDGGTAGAPGETDAERAAWLADKIGALGDYAKEAAAMLRRWPAGVKEVPLALEQRTDYRDAAYCLEAHIRTLRLSGRNDALVEDMEKASRLLRERTAGVKEDQRG